MKKFNLGKLAALALLAAGAAGFAHAATVTSPGGVSFNVTGGCTVLGNVLNVGNYTAGQTVETYAARQGRVNGDAGYAYTAGTDAPGKLATVNCGVGTAWTLRLDGAGFQGNTNVTDPGGAFAFQTNPRSAFLDGVARQDGLRTDSAGLGSTGTGVDQIVTGHYNVFTYPGQGAVYGVILRAGNYSGSNTARLDF